MAGVEMMIDSDSESTIARVVSDSEMNPRNCGVMRTHPFSLFILRGTTPISPFQERRGTSFRDKGLLGKRGVILA